MEVVGFPSGIVCIRSGYSKDEFEFLTIPPRISVNAYFRDLYARKHYKRYLWIIMTFFNLILNPVS